MLLRETETKGGSLYLYSFSGRGEALRAVLGYSLRVVVSIAYKAALTYWLIGMYHSASDVAISPCHDWARNLLRKSMQDAEKDTVRSICEIQIRYPRRLPATPDVGKSLSGKSIVATD